MVPGGAEFGDALRCRRVPSEWPAEALPCAPRGSQPVERSFAPKLYRDFVHGKGTVSVTGSKVTVAFPRRAHSPILRGVPWQNVPGTLLAPRDGALTLRFA